MSKIYLFADDTKIYREIKDEGDYLWLQEDLNSMNYWSEKWLLKFHPGKCHVLDIGNKDETNRYEYKIEGKILEYVNQEKDLGVTTDRELNFKAHISEKVNKANSIAGVIRRSFIALDEYIFKKLFTALVRPHLEYAQSVWSPYWVADITAI